VIAPDEAAAHPAVTPAATNEGWPLPKQGVEAAAPPSVLMPMSGIGQAQAAPAPHPASAGGPPAGGPPAGMPPVVGSPVVGSPAVGAPVDAPHEATAPSEGPAATAAAASAVVPPLRSDTRVFAKFDSWIELRGPAGDVLTQTYVRAGESYTVPAGISYRIINAR
jgi:cytoskeleton protein RodZ